MDAQISYVQADVRELARRLNELERQLESEREMRFLVRSAVAVLTLTALMLVFIWHRLGWV